MRQALHSARRRGALTRSVLIAGSRSHIDDIAQVLSRETWLGYRVVGALTPEYDLSEETATGVPVLGDANDAPAVAAEHGADVIFFAGGSVGSASVMRKMFWTLEQQQISVVVAPSVTDISGERVRVRPVGGLPLIHVDPPTWSDASRWGKRLFDVLGSAGLILVFSPVMAVIASWIVVADRGPVFFRQDRIGRHGQTFSCLKFRSMVVDAEARLAALHQETGFDRGLFKMTDDPRITRPGRFLRRFSLDELAQLFNVFRGDMSLVGPRPPLPSEVATYDDDVARRLHVRPGMTGLWQVSGRSDLSWDEAIRLDLYYVDNWSMLQDLAILARTAGRRAQLPRRVLSGGAPAGQQVGARGPHVSRLRRQRLVRTLRACPPAASLRACERRSCAPAGLAPRGLRWRRVGRTRSRSRSRSRRRGRSSSRAPC